jgi:hypothetical protein
MMGAQWVREGYCAAVGVIKERRCVSGVGWGPTGCDKSTLLWATAGLEISAAGEIHFSDRVAIHVPANERDGAMAVSGARKNAMPRG